MSSVWVTLIWRLRIGELWGPKTGIGRSDE
jgi:hypothetical protein